MPNTCVPVVPSLFVGLGSTGYSVLQTLEKLIVEEFGTARLPIFRMVVFETQQQDPKRPSLDVESAIQVERITIDDMQKVTYLLESDPDSNRSIALREWLSPSIRDGGDPIIHGAGGIRAAGRLALWHNWDRVRSVLVRAWDDVRGFNQTDTIGMLRKHWMARGVAVDDARLLAPMPVIYMVGTLAGGTCSGTFLDLAYLLRDIRGAQTKVDIKSIFTLLNRNEAADPLANNGAANCLAALRELDFHLQDDLPPTWSRANGDGERSIGPKQMPFKPCYILTDTSDRGTVGRIEDLNQTIALRLFLGAVGGQEGVLNGEHDDMMKKPEWREHNYEGYMRQIFSFGLTVIWYPRYRIATVASCRAGIELCNRWLGENSHLDEAKDLAKKEAAAILERISTALERTTGTALGDHVDRTIQQQLSKLGEESSQADIRQTLEETNFNELVTSLYDQAPRQAADELKGIGEKLHALFPSRLGDAEQLSAYASTLADLLRKQLADRPPVLEFGGGRRVDWSDPAELDDLDIEFEQTVNDTWVRWAWLGGNARERAREGYGFIVGRRLKKTVREYQASAVTKCLKLVCDRLDEATAFARQLKSNMNDVRTYLRERAAAESQVPDLQVVELVYRYGRLEDDVQDCLSKIGEITPRVLTDVLDKNKTPTSAKDATAFWLLPVAQARTQILEYFQREALAKLNLQQGDNPSEAFNVVKHMPRETRNKVRKLVELASPFLVLSPEGQHRA